MSDTALSSLIDTTISYTWLLEGGELLDACAEICADLEWWEIEDLIWGLDQRGDYALAEAVAHC